MVVLDGDFCGLNHIYFLDNIMLFDHQTPYFLLYLKGNIKMYNKVFLTAIGLLFLTNCSPVSGAKDGATKVAFKSEEATGFVAGYQPVDIEVTKKNSEKSLLASCKLDSSKYSASFTTPAKVNIPGYSRGAVNVNVTCNYEGEEYSKSFAPVNLSKRARSNSAVAVGVLLCPICGVGMAVGNAAKKKKVDTKDNQTIGDIYGFTKLKLEI
jgi:hypothetical protein